jgi:hypothetical protein
VCKQKFENLYNTLRDLAKVHFIIPLSFTCFHVRNVKKICEGVANR